MNDTSAQTLPLDQAERPSTATYKGYWMITNRCNLSCSYCVLEDAPHQLARELDLEGKKALASHLYERLSFRRLTLSGGEATLIGRRAPTEFIALLRHLSRYRSADPTTNLQLELYSNGARLTEAVADVMAGVVDEVALTVDSADDERLASIGRNQRERRDYLEHIARICGWLTARGIAIKLHTVVGTLTHASIALEAPLILQRIHAAGGRVSAWKFYQYMSYDVPSADGLHAISVPVWETCVKNTRAALNSAYPGHQIALHFKDNNEMNASLFNILSYGNAQYMRSGDTWSTTRRTRDLRSYPSMDALFSEHDIDEAAFRRFHELQL